MASSDRSGIRRRFTLLDCAILIAATGVGLALLRVCLDGFPYRSPARSPQAALQIRMTWIVTAVSVFLCCWTIALLALGLWPPRAPFRRLARQPGFVASADATVGIAAHLTVWTIELTLGHIVFDARNVSRIVGGFEIYASPMVAGAWLSFLLSGRWKPVATWVDWAGRVIGSAWIALLLVSHARTFI